MNDVNEKLKNALRAFLATYRFEPINSGPQFSYDKEYIDTFEDLRRNSDGETVQLQLRRQEHDHLISVLQELFPKQIHRSKLRTELLRVCKEWIEKDYVLENDNHIENLANNLLTSLNSLINNLIILIPIDGLIIETSDKLKILKCVFSSNNKGSKLRVAAKNLEMHYENFNLDVFNNAPTFAECR